jgi:arylsulfatase A-like enzyme
MLSCDSGAAAIEARGSFASCSDMTNQQIQRPNIILINADDLGWTDLGVMGSAFYETPHIDKLAASGCLYSKAYASAPNCAPSRANMITGRMPGAHGVYTVHSSDRGIASTRRLIPVENNEGDIPSDLPTIGHALKEQGYTTGVIGKWHVSQNPLEFGFDYNVAGCKKGHPPSYFAPYRIESLEDGDEGEYLPERLASEAVRFIESNIDRPFFLYYPTYLVHTPLQGKDEAVEKYKAKIERGESDERHFNPVYAAMVEELDRCVGKIVDSLEKLGLRKNTLLIFTSDNGGVREISLQTPLRAGKGALYEGGIRVPLIVSCPGRVPAGTHSTRPITNLDFYPSLLKVAGGSPEGRGLDGVDVSESFWDPMGASPERDLLWHFPAYLQATQRGVDDSRDLLFRTRPGTALQRGPWKLHYYYEDQGYELYHLGEDISERKDIKDEHPELVKEMKAEMERLIELKKLKEPSLLNPEFDEADHQKRLDAIKAESEPSAMSEDDWYRVMKLID